MEINQSQHFFFVFSCLRFHKFFKAHDALKTDQAGKSTLCVCVISGDAIMIRLNWRRDLNTPTKYDGDGRE